MQTTSRDSFTIFSVSWRGRKDFKTEIFASFSACALLGLSVLPSSACSPAERTEMPVSFLRLSSRRSAASAMGERQVLPVQTKSTFCVGIRPLLGVAFVEKCGR